MNKINWKGETPIRLQNCLINEFGSDFDLNNKDDRLAVREKRRIMSIPNFGRKSWKYLENYLLVRWPEDSETKPDATFNISRRFYSRKDKGNRNFRIWIDRQEGMKFSEIAKKNKISNGRAFQIYWTIENRKKYFLPEYQNFLDRYKPKKIKRRIYQPHYEDRKIEIWWDRKKGLTYKKIADKYKLNYSTVRNIYLQVEADKRKRWGYRKSIFLKELKIDL